MVTSAELSAGNNAIRGLSSRLLPAGGVCDIKPSRREHDYKSTAERSEDAELTESYTSLGHTSVAAGLRQGWHRVQIEQHRTMYNVELRVI
jgi:hypothetical protein